PVRAGDDIRGGAGIRGRVGTASVRAVVGDIELIDVPATGRVRRLTDGDVEVVAGRESTARGVGFKRQRDEEKALRSRIIQAARVRHELPEAAGISGCNAAIDRRRVAEERVEVDGMV